MFTFSPRQTAGPCYASVLRLSPASGTLRATVYLGTSTTTEAVCRGLSGRAAPQVSRRVIPTERTKTSDHSASGLLRLLGVDRGAVLLRTVGGIARQRPLGLSDLGRDNRTTKNSVCSGSSGVVRSGRRQVSRQRAPANSGAASPPSSWALGPAVVDELGSVNVIARFDRRAGLQRFRA